MKLAIIIPCYNEEAVLPETTKRLCGILDDMTAAGSIDEGIILYIDDGSRDSTWSLIEQFSGADNKVAGLKLSHNRGASTRVMGRPRVGCQACRRGRVDRCRPTGRRDRDTEDGRAVQRRSRHCVRRAQGTRYGHLL